MARWGRTARKRRWKPSEKNYLRSHCRSGADAIAHHLGRSRSAVESMASRMGVSLSRAPWQPSAVCPRCGVHELVPGGAGWYEGLCPVCHYDMLTRRSDDRADEARAKRQKGAQAD